MTSDLFLAPDADESPTIWRANPDALDQPVALLREREPLSAGTAALDAELWAILAASIEADLRLRPDLADLRATLIANVHEAAVEQIGANADVDRATRAIDALMPDIDAAFRRALYAGADHAPVDPACWPTPGQWVARFLSLNGEGRQEMARRALACGEVAETCVIAGHASLLDEVTEAAVARRELVTLTAWMAENDWPANEIARAVEKPSAYADELTLALHAAEALADPGVTAALPPATDKEPACPTPA